MHFYEHSYSTVAFSIKLQSVKSVHNYNLILLSWQVLYGNINCQNVIDIFPYKSQSYGLRDPKTLVGNLSGINSIFMQRLIGSKITYILKTFVILPPRN